MAQVNFQQTDVFVDGALTCTTFICPDGSINDADVQAAAGIAASKLQHQRQNLYRNGNNSGTTVATENACIASVYGATGLLVTMKAWIVTVGAGGGMSVTVALQRIRSGVTTTVSSSVITINAATTAYQEVNVSGFTDTAMLQGDKYELVVVATLGGGTLPKGLCVMLVFKEDAQ